MLWVLDCYWLPAIMWNTVGSGPAILKLDWICPCLWFLHRVNRGSTELQAFCLRAASPLVRTGLAPDKLHFGTEPLIVTLVPPTKITH